MTKANHTSAVRRKMPRGQKIHLQDDAQHFSNRESVLVHHDNEVQVFTDGPTVRGESPAGVGWLVTPSVVVMRQSGRGATPGLPTHITVPAASGGSRAPQETIKVLGVVDSDVFDDWVALQLDRECLLPTTGAAPEGLDLSRLSVADVAPALTGDEPQLLGGDHSALIADDDVMTGDGWLCRCFPRLPGCR